MSDAEQVGIAPFHASGALQGFVICGRWPNSMREWTQVLTLAVRVATIPGLLSTTTVFGAREDRPETELPDAVGLVVYQGTVLGECQVTPGSLAGQLPPALIMLHPPSETRPSIPECEGAASGCVLLPGVPHLGLEHRASWVETDADGTVTSLVSRVGIDLIGDPDTAVLAMLLAA